MILFIIGEFCLHTLLQNYLYSFLPVPIPPCQYPLDFCFTRPNMCLSTSVGFCFIRPISACPHPLDFCFTRLDIRLSISIKIIEECSSSAFCWRVQHIRLRLWRATCWMCRFWPQSKPVSACLQVDRIYYFIQMILYISSNFIVTVQRWRRVLVPTFLWASWQRSDVSRVFSSGCLSPERICLPT